MRALLSHFFAGMRLLMMRRGAMPPALSPALLLIPILASEAIVMAADYLTTGKASAPMFDHAIWQMAVTLAVFLILIASSTRVFRAFQSLEAWCWIWLPLTLLQEGCWWVLSVSPAGQSLDDSSIYWLGWMIWVLPSVWAAAAIGRLSIRTLRASRVILMMIALICVDTGGRWLASLHPYFDDVSQGDNPHTLLDETLLYRQSALLDQQIRHLPDRKAGQTNVYLLAIAGNGEQQAFENEAKLAQASLGGKLNVLGSILLANRPDTAEAIPLATRISIAASLEAIAAKAHREEDQIVVFITSHGSERYELQLNQPPLEFDPVTPDWLASALSSTGIKRRIVILSSCFAGGFIPALANDDTIIMTAADSKHPSFGCSNDADLTWFGRALFTYALPQSDNLIAAMPRLQRIIASWEKAQHLEPSNPQLYAGKHAQP